MGGGGLVRELFGFVRGRESGLKSQSPCIRKRKFLTCSLPPHNLERPCSCSIYVSRSLSLSLYLSLSLSSRSICLCLSTEPYDPKKPPSWAEAPHNRAKDFCLALTPLERAGQPQLPKPKLKTLVPNLKSRALSTESEAPEAKVWKPGPCCFISLMLNLLV